MKTKYADCTYGAFISYAHADDRSNFSWISHFRKELQSKLSGDLARTPGGAKPFHLSQDNGPIRGDLGDELRSRVEESFALIVIAGHNYLDSEWCLKELRVPQRPLRWRRPEAAALHPGITGRCREPGKEPF